MRLTLPLTLALVLLGCEGHADAAGTNSAAQEAPLKLVYQRSGGFAGFLDRLEVSGDSLTLSRRNKVTFQRKLTAEEHASLAQLSQAALASTAPGKLGAPGADTFHIELTVGDAASPQLVADGHGGPSGLNPAWEALLAKVGPIFTAALAGK